MIEKVSDHYNRRAVSYGREPRACNYRFRGSYLQRQRVVMKRLQGITGRRILDVGCGPGLFSEPLARSNFLVGVDLSENMLRLARGILKPVGGEGEHLAFQDELFDITLSIETLQHVGCPEIFLKELARVTRPDGRIILSSLNRDSLLHRILGGKSNFFHPLEAVCSFLEKEGWVPVEIRFLGFPLPLTWPSPLKNRGLSFLATSWVVEFRKRP